MLSVQLIKINYLIIKVIFIISYFTFIFVRQQPFERHVEQHEQNLNEKLYMSCEVMRQLGLNQMTLHWGYSGMSFPCETSPVGYR